MEDFLGLGLILGLGLAVGLATALWCLLTGGSLLLAFLGYSLGGTVAALVGALYIAVATRPCTEGRPVIAD